MSACRILPAQWLRRLAYLFLTTGIAVAASRPSLAQPILTTRSVGGISIDADGVLRNATVDDLGRLSRLRLQALAKVPEPLGRRTELRKISLARLEAAIEECKKQHKELPDEIKYLAGLQKIEYVFVDPESQDIILAGPAEGWKVDRRGFVVGVTTGRPVILLDDLLVALRNAREGAESEISCSIDPTAEGLARLQKHVAGLRSIGHPVATAKGIEDALGRQTISVEGIPGTTHFARVLVAADYRMKRLAMGLDRSPVRGLPSYPSMIQAGPRGINNLLPRWWLEPTYASVLRDEDGLCWELRGSSVKAMTEEDFLTASGQRQHTGQAGAVARRWADKMTAQFDQLSVADPVFGQLRNCMDLTVVAALVVKHRLGEKAGCRLPMLADTSGLAPERYAAPKHVASKASLWKKGSNWIIAVSGGVKLKPEAVLRRARVDAELKARRIEAAVGKHDDWWWN